MAYDVQRIRADFPILATRVRDGKPLVYLDNAATTQKPQVVIDALDTYYTTMNANVHRGIHRLAELATQHYEESRTAVVQFIHASSERNVIFTRGTTEGINLVAHAWGRKFLKSGDEIVLTEMEHHSNLVPWQLLAKATGTVLKFVPVLDDGTLDLDAYGKLLGGRTKLVAFAHGSNVLGTVNPAKKMIAEAHRVGAVVVLDAAQTVPHRPVDVQDLDADFVAFSGHKMAGPTGIGVLYGRESLLDAMDPFHGGGEMIEKVFLDHSTWAALPSKFEAGTPNIAGAIGLGAAIVYLQKIGIEQIHLYEAGLAAFTVKRLESIVGVKVYGHASDRGGAISFSLEGVHPHDIAHFLDRDGIAVRAGHMCAQPLMRRFGVPAMSRASLYLYSTQHEIELLCEGIERVRAYFNRATR